MRIGTTIGSIVCQVGDKFPCHGTIACIVRTPPMPSRVFFLSARKKAMARASVSLNALWLAVRVHDIALVIARGLTETYETNEAGEAGEADKTAPIRRCSQARFCMPLCLMCLVRFVACRLRLYSTPECVGSYPLESMAISRKSRRG